WETDPPGNFRSSRRPPHAASWAGVAEAFRARGLRLRKVAVETVSVPLRTYLLGAGQFVSAMPKSVASHLPVKILPVKLPDRPWPFAVSTLKSRTLSPVVERFVSHLREYARSMSGKKSARKAGRDAG